MSVIVQFICNYIGYLLVIFFFLNRIEYMLWDLREIKRTNENEKQRFKEWLAEYEALPELAPAQVNVVEQKVSPKRHQNKKKKR